MVKDLVLYYNMRTVHKFNRCLNDQVFLPVPVSVRASGKQYHAASKEIKTNQKLHNSNKSWHLILLVYYLS